MAQQVRVTSIDALESLRAALIIFLTKARRSLDDVGDDVRRTRMWLQHDQRSLWEGRVRQRHKTLGQAEQELLSAKLSGLRDNLAVQQAAVRKARAALDEAEGKLRNVKRWNRDFDSSVDPLLKRLEGLRGYLDFELPEAIAFLVQAQRTLDAYMETPPPAAAPVVPPTDSDL
ncbi:MAG: hypothetical protein K8R23_00550 [Chthoniobacter sp.]|nr:hypothetical protein [Chthoniobacter sp.]